MRILLIVFLIGVTVRGAWGLYRISQDGPDAALQYPDERWYWHLAESLHRGDGLVGEFGHRAGRMPLYPALLSLFAGLQHGVAWARVWQWFLGAITPLAVAALAYQLSARIRLAGAQARDDNHGDRDPAPLNHQHTRATAVAWAAGLIVAVDPLLMGMASLLLTETLLVTGVALLWWASWVVTRASASRRRTVGRWAIVVLAAVLCVYTRPSSIGLVVCLSLFLAGGARPTRPAMVGMAILWATILLALLPWALRNQRLLGERVWLSTRAGISLYDGVRPGADGSGNLAAIKDLPAVRHLDELEWNRYFLDRAHEAVRDNPGRTLRLAAVKLARTWSPFPHADALRAPWITALFAGWTVCWYALVLVGALALRRQKPTLLYLLLPAMYLGALHAVFVGSVRYRLGAAPALAVLAGWGCVTLWSRWMGRRPVLRHV